MNRKTMLKLSPVAAAVMLALGSAAHAAAPAANALPGAFLTNQATTAVTYTINTTTGATIVVPGAANTVLQFGGATNAVASNAITPTVTPTSGVTTVAGFNIGSAATLTFNAGGASANVLVSDLTGQASNVDGTIATTGTNLANLFIANPNGVVVGGSAVITGGNVALVGYQADEGDFQTNGQVTVGVSPSVAATLTSPSKAGSATATANGAVTVTDGATVNAGYLLVAGAGQVNVGAVAGGAAVNVAAGASATATSTAVNLGSTVLSASAVANLGGTSTLTVAGLAAAGAVNTSNTVSLNNATVGGTLTNTGTLSLGGVNNVGALVNSVSVATADNGTYGSITNNAYATIGGADNVASFTNSANGTVNGPATFGAITNNANLVAAGPLVFGGAFANTGKVSLGGALLANSSTASVNNSGVLTNTLLGTLVAPVNATNTLASFTNTGTIYDGGYGIQVTAGSINLGGTVATSSTASTIGPVLLTAATGDVVGTASLSSAGLVQFIAAKGNVNYTGAIASSTAVIATATTGAVTLGAVKSTSVLQAHAGNGNLTLGGNVTDVNTSLNATGGSIYVNGNITDGGSVSATADNQIMINGTVSATTGTVSLTTNKVWTGAYNLGVVIQPSGGINAANVVVNAADNMLQYGTLASTTGFSFTGNSYYQGAGAAINASRATFNFGISTTASAAIAGGIVAGSANPQPSGAFFNAVMVGGSNATNGVTLNVGAHNLGTEAQNVNLMGIGNTTLNTLPSTSTLFGPTGSAVINTSFVPSNLFVRAQGGNLAISANDAANFYWPGLVYASTVKAGMVSTVDTTKTITVGGGTAAFSNALPYQATGGAGIYLMTGKVNVGDITVNTNSNINVLNSLQVAGLNLYTAAAPTGLVLTYSATLPAANVVDYTPPAN
jgi:filamentous hemagglutinin family protein